MKRIILVTSSNALLGSLTACNTIKGAGQDVSAAGPAVSKSAEKVKEGM